MIQFCFINLYVTNSNYEIVLRNRISYDFDQVICSLIPFKRFLQPLLFFFHHPILDVNWKTWNDVKTEDRILLIIGAHEFKSKAKKFTEVHHFQDVLAALQLMNASVPRTVFHLRG